MTGAIVVCDTLGFKGIWDRYKDHGKVLAKLQQVKDLARWVVKSVSSNVQACRSDIELRAAARVFSDTVVFATWSEASSQQEKDKLQVLYLACKMTVALIDQGQQPEIPFAYRGCISFGEFYLAEELIVGPAIDEAAEYMNTPDGAFVWLGPSAEALLEEHKTTGGFETVNPSGIHGNVHFDRVLDHPEVPLKDGRSLTAWVVNPYAYVLEGRLLSKRILASFNTPSLDVRIKKQNTAHFLDKAYERRDMGSQSG